MGSRAKAARAYQSGRRLSKPQPPMTPQRKAAMEAAWAARTTGTQVRSS